MRIWPRRSPSTSIVRVEARIAVSAVCRASGTSYPRDRTLEVNRLVEGRWLEVDIFEGDGAVRAEPFEAIALTLGDLWRW